MLFVSVQHELSLVVSSITVQYAQSEVVSFVAL